LARAQERRCARLGERHAVKDRLWSVPAPAHGELAEGDFQPGLVADEILERRTVLRHARRDQLAEEQRQAGDEHRATEQGEQAPAPVPSAAVAGGASARRGSRHGWRLIHDRVLNEYDVVLIHAVEGLDLQADRTTHLRLELAERGGLLIEQAVHDVLMSEYQQLATGKLPALSHNFPKNLVAHGFRGADEAAPLAAWTGLAQQVFQA